MLEHGSRPSIARRLILGARIKHDQCTNDRRLLNGHFHARPSFGITETMAVGAWPPQWSLSEPESMLPVAFE